MNVVALTALILSGAVLVVLAVYAARVSRSSAKGKAPQRSLDRRDSEP